MLHRAIFILAAVLVPSLVLAQVVFPNRGGTGTSTPPQPGYVLVGTANGTYAPRATSTLGIVGGGGGDGTVTSVGFIAPTGFTASGSPVTSAGMLELLYAAGYGPFLTASGTAWQSFYTTPSGRITAGTGIDWSGNTLNATLGDFSTTDLTEGTNLYYLDSRARAALSDTVPGLTYTSGTGVLSLDNGYVIPTTTRAATWDTAYGWGNHASQGYITDGNTNWDNSYGFITDGNTGWDNSYNFITATSVPARDWVSPSGYLTPSTTLGISVAGSSTIQSLSVVRSTTTAATSTNLFSTVLSATTAFLTNLIGTNATITNATTTSLRVSGPFSFGGVIGTSWPDFCIAMTGGSGLCDGVDATGGDGSSISTSTTPVLGELSYWTSPSTLGTVATGTLTETAAGLEFSATRGLVGGSSVLSISSGYNIPLTASTTNWNTAYGWGNHASQGYITDGNTGWDNSYGYVTQGQTVGTTTAGVAGQAAYWTGIRTLGTVATGTLTENVLGLELDNSTRGLFGGSAAISLTSGYAIPSTTRMSLWDSASGTVTSVAMSVPTGFTISGTPITSAGTLGLGFTAGYFLPTTSRASNWDTAFSWGNHASQGYITDGNTNWDNSYGFITDGNSGWDNSYGLITATNATASITYATTTNLAVPTSLNLFGGGVLTTNNALCIQLTGSADLCDGNDASGGGGGVSDWIKTAALDAIRPTTTVGISVAASSTIGNGTATGGLTINGGATTTGDLAVQGTGYFNGGYVQIPGTTPYLDLNETDQGKFGGFYMQDADLHAYVDTGGTIDFMNSITLANTGVVDLNASTFTGPLVPTLDDSWDLGSASKAWAGLWLGPDECISFKGVECVIAEQGGDGQTVTGLILQPQGIASSGRVGIGSSTPYAKLSLQGWTTDGLQDLFRISSSTNTNLFKVDAFGTTTMLTASSTYSSVASGIQLFGGGYKTTANELCIQLTGSAALCDGNDATGGGGSSISTSSTPVAGNLSYWTSPSTLSDVATGTLTTTATGLELSATRGLVGGASILSLSSGYFIPTTTRASNWDTAFSWGNHAVAGYDQVTTAGDGLTRTANDFDCDTASGSTFGCLTSTDWNTFNGKESVLTFSGGLTRTVNNIAPTTGYNIPLTASTTNWNTAFNWGNHASQGYITDGNTGWDNSYGLITATNATASITHATATNLYVPTSINLFGGGPKTTANDLCIQLTGSADLCDGVDGGGGGSSKWTDGTNFTYLTQTTYDLALGRNSTTTAPFWWDVSATTSYIGNGGGGDSVVQLGATNNEWTIGYDETDKSFAISSSTALGTNNALTIAKNLLTTIQLLSVTDSTTTNATTSNLRVSTSFNLLGDVITNVATWFSTKLNAVSSFVAAAASTWDFSAAESVEIPNGTGPTINAAGEIALDTTEDQLIMADGAGTARVFATDEFRVISITMASSSLQFDSGDTLPVLGHKDGLEITQYRCYVVGGTSKVVNLTDGTNDTETITCGTTMTSDTDVATNDTFTADELGYLEMGATTGTVNYLHFEAYARITRE